MNESQEKAVHAHGPTLVIAGPGTGKTYTIIQRVLYLIQEKQVKPEEIMLVTYTVKATKELTTRLTNELSRRGIEVNLHDMYLGTFHQVCRKILKEFREYTSLERNYLETDQFEQRYLVYGYLKEFEDIPGFDTVIPPGYNKKDGFHPFSPWQRCQRICGYVSNLAEELLDPEEMRRKWGDKLDGRMEVMGRMMMKYERLLREENFVDYTKLQTETYHLLQNHPEIRKQLQQRIRYLMIDEYQDTDYIQEQLIRLLSRDGENIFVVGDDDQSIYRFRGATVGNILEFTDKYPSGACQVFKLDTNYRSSQGIVDFCARWMTRLNPDPGIWKKGEGRYFRYLKGTMKSGSPGVKPSVIRITAPDRDAWQKRVSQFIMQLKENDYISDYNQVAVLWNSVKHFMAQDLQNALESKGIPVYAPRAGHFFQRKEVALFLGCLLYLFPCFSEHMEDFSEVEETENIYWDYMKYLGMAKECMSMPGEEALKQWMEQTRAQMVSGGEMPCSLLDMVYSLLALPPFSQWLDKGASEEVPAVRNLSILTKLMSRFGYFLQDNHGHGRETLSDVCLFFSRYLRLWYENRVDEYEDEERYAPAGKVSFLNIHQAKGLEYPVVIVASLYENVWSDKNWIPDAVKIAGGRASYEPEDHWAGLDFLRKYYTAFSRAETLLVLAYPWGEEKRPSRYFKKAVASVWEYDHPRISYEKMTFRPIKDACFKPRFAYTTQIALYEECPLKYKWSRVYRFAPSPGRGLLFGQLVHETIEDVHRAVLRGEKEALQPSVLYGWLMANYSSLAKKENTWLSQDKLQQAFQEVASYVNHRKGLWETVQEAEMPLELVTDDYIMTGTIDLMQGNDDTIQLVDFKTGKKPELSSSQMQRYRGQLEVYAYLAEQKWKKPVSTLILYFTGDPEPIVSFPATKERVEERIRQFDDTVHHIMEEDFARRLTRPEKHCEFCDWKPYCWKRQ